MTLEQLAQSYVKSLPEEKRSNVEHTFDIYNAYLAGLRYNPLLNDADNVNTNDLYGSIIALVCKYYGVTIHQVKSPSRHGEIPYYRHLCIYLGDKYTKLKQAQLTSYFGRARETYYNSIKYVNNMLETDRIRAADITILQKKIETRLL